MRGWKTWLAAAGMAALGAIDIKQGDYPAGMQKIVAALALVGIGHKIEKAGTGAAGE